ncbi:MAG TPA: zinc-binding dehydrogenase [Candidatus Eremiobacteraceae bacterium]|nr:zinc-binding dehydrogenase [Candidatus Eremiobacteraceae bacterium]
MRAAYAAKLGGDTPLENLEVGERPMPEPGRGDVRVRVRAVTLNHHDYFTLRGIVGYPIQPPRILGCDASGVIDAHGPDAGPLAQPVGADVVVYPVRFCGACPACFGPDPMLCRRFTMLSDGDVEGSLAEYVVVPAQAAVPKPASLDFGQAACMGVTFLTAYRMLFVKAGLEPGDSVLIQGAGGGLATAAIQLASAAGCTVIVTSRSEARRAAALRIGAHHAIESGKDAAKAVLRLTNGDGVDAVIESVGEPTWGTSLRAVRQGGAVVVAGATSGPNPPADLSRIFWRQLRILGSTMGSLPEFERLLRFVDTRGIKPVIDSTYSLADVRDAFDRLAAGDHFGKLVVVI